MKTKEQEKENAKRIYSTKGITLVALVVTIIVLIILAGVSISLVLGENGIITKTKYSKQVTLNAQVAEQEQLNEVASYLETLGGNSESTTSGIALSELEVGDYIKYNTGKTEIGDNGVVLCRILYNDETNGLQIITDKNITQKVDGVNTEIKVTLGGGESWEEEKSLYNGAIKTLNDEAEKYININYVIDARCVGSLPVVDLNGNFTEKDKGTEKTVILSSDWTLPDGLTSTDTGFFEGDENYKYDQTVMNEAKMWTTEQSYWLASRNAELLYGYYYFGVESVSNNGSLGNTSLTALNNEGFWQNLPLAYGLRPCFSLKSDIKVTGEGGKTADTAYVIE